MAVAASYDDIVRFEIRRQGPIFGLDRKDVYQEVRLVVEKCAPLVQGNSGRTYIRRSIRNALANLKRAMSTRMPRDARGRSESPLSLDGMLDSPEGDSWRVPHALVTTRTPEQAAETAELVSALEVMPENDRKLLYEAFVDGVYHRHSRERLEQARKRAEQILTRLLAGEERKTMAKPNVPECHTDGTDPVGYETDLADAEDCQGCAEKFTCLVEGIKKGLVEGIDLSADPEVKAFAHGLVPLSKLKARVNDRNALLEAGKEVPDDLAYNQIPGIMDQLNAASNDVPTLSETMEAPVTKTKKTKTKKTEPEVQEEAPAPKKAKAPKPPKEAPAEEAPAPKAAKKKGAKAKPAKEAPAEEAPAPKAAKKKGAKAKPAKEAPAPKAAKKGAKAKAEKPAKPAKAKRVKDGAAPNNRMGEKGAYKYDGKPKTLEDGSIRLPNQRTVPAPKKTTKEKMQLALERLNGKMGLSFDLEVGMKLTQERRGGDNITIAVKSDGFYYNDNPYTSLSAACMAATLRSVSGVEMFNFDKHYNIVVSGKSVPNGKFRKDDAE